ncbi:hypothetical protein E2C01_012963 [Portunus trituberculatus]|uniref:Uncharacterized protein n=1 Tax=Portunus trituberculatus TaxID=210409 RepID=A0A5B7DFP1_PORTR|nr:hypothetical protein [Portunus trituberculatus]
MAQDGKRGRRGGYSGGFGVWTPWPGCGVGLLSVYIEHHRDHPPTLSHSHHGDLSHLPGVRQLPYTRPAALLSSATYVASFR